MTDSSPSTYDVIIIGGGVIGLSTAMQLAFRGVRPLVIERDRLGSGSTSRAAGNLGQLRGTPAQTRFQIDAVTIIRDLEARTGSELFIPSGSLRIAETPERVAEIQDLVAMGRALGLAAEDLPIAEVARMAPYMRTDDLLKAVYFPTDGHVKPAELAAAYTQVGRKLGVTYRTQEWITEILLDGHRAIGVRTNLGEYHAPAVVNAAGPWSYFVAGMTRTTLATTALGHYYITTRPDPARPIDRLGPVVRDRHHRIYARPESGGLLVGMYETEPVLYRPETFPVDFDMLALKAARDDLNVAHLIAAAGQRYPWINERTPMSVTTGIMTFSPDSQPLCGRLPDYEGLYYATGMSGRGIVQSPTIGLIMAELILDGRSRYDLESITADRYYRRPGYCERPEIEAKCIHMYATIYGGVEQTATKTEPRG